MRGKRSLGDSTSPKTVASQLAALPPLPVLLGGGEPIAKPPINLETCNSVTGPVSRGNGAGVGENATVEDFINETTVWKQIEKSLSLPALYRSREDLALTLRMLRRVHYLNFLMDEDLTTIANFMSIETVNVQGSVIYVKTEPEPEMADSESESENGDEEQDAKPIREKHLQKDELQTAMSGGDQRYSQSLSSPRFRSPTLEEHSMMSGVSLVQPVYYPESPVRILVRGKVLLEIPTINGMQHYPVLPLDTFGNELWTDPLPVGSRYMSTEPCTIVVLNPGDQKLNRVLARADKLMLEEQKRYLRDMIKVKIFESWQEADFERCAKRFVPLRLESFQVIIEECEHSDCLYFLKEGQLTVTRLVRPHKGKKARPNLLGTSSRLTSPRGESPRHTANLIRTVRDPALSPNEHVMQVASLNPGEFFGELGLLAHDPDVRPGENTVWTDKYWTDALTNRFRQPDVLEKASLVKELRGNSEKAESSTSEPPPPPDGRGANVDIRYPQKTTNRTATVYAQLPSVVYRFSFDDCRENIGGLALTRLMEFVKGYPAHDELYEQFEKQLKWTVYRDEFIADVFRQNRKTQRGEHLPNLKI